MICHSLLKMVSSYLKTKREKETIPFETVCMVSCVMIVRVVLVWRKL